MKCQSVLLAKLRRLWPFAFPASTANLRPTSAVGCHSAPPTSKTRLPVETQNLALDLPLTLRGVKWSMVKRLDSNTALKRSVIESNRRDLMRILGRGR
jgi:hypothetical protein